MAAMKPFMLTRNPLRTKPSDGDWAQVNGDLRNVMIDPWDLCVMVSAGHAFTAWHAQNLRRKQNWRRAAYLAVDLENHPSATLDEAEKNSMTTAYATFAYTTLSHTPQAPRCRVVFVLAEPLSDVELWHRAQRMLTTMYTAADPSGADVSRLFLGAGAKGEVRMYGHVMDATTVQSLARAWENAHQPRTVPTSGRGGYALQPGEKPSLDKWANDVRNAVTGTRNHTLNRSAWLAGRHLVRTGLLSLHVVEQSLFDAAIGAGLTEHEVHKTLTQSIQKGASQ